MVKFTKLLNLILIRVFARLFEEICQIHFVSAVGIGRKTDGLDQNWIIVLGIEKCAVHAAKVDKIEGGSSHDEHWFKFVAIGNVGKMKDFSAVLIHGKLANALQFPVYQRLISQKLALKGNTAASAKCLLLLLALNG